MSFNSKRVTVISLLFLIAATQAYLSASFAAPGSGIPIGNPEMAPSQTIGISMGVLTTQGNNEISVNGVTSITGATILSGASIETPAGISATVSFSNGHSLEVEPNTKLTLEFDQNFVKAMLTEGCVHLRTKGAVGEIVTAKGSVGKTDPSKDDTIETCPSHRAGPTVLAGAGGLFRLSTAAAAAIIGKGATTVAVPVAPRGVLY